MKLPLIRWLEQGQTVLSFRLLVALLALGTCLLGVVVPRWFDRMGSRFDALAKLECQTARSAYENGGPRKLSLVMQQHESESGVGAWLFNEDGHGLAGGPERSSLLKDRPMFSRLLAKIRGESRRDADARLAGQIGKYSCVITTDLRDRSFFATRSIRLLAFVSVLFCAISGYLALRLRRLETAISSFGAGELETRMESDSRDPIRRLSAAFNRMADRVESLVDANRRLCMDISHELRSPLTRLRLAIGLARSGTGGALDQIELESFRLNDLVDQLLDVARAEVDPAILKSETIDMRSLMAEVADACAIEAREHGCELDLRTSQPSNVVGDPELLRRAIENPLRNAIRHSPPGSVIEILAGGDDEFAVVSIGDQGPGVPESALQDIFRPFYACKPGVVAV